MCKRYCTPATSSTRPGDRHSCFGLQRLILFAEKVEDRETGAQQLEMRVEEAFADGPTRNVSPYV